MLPLVRIAAIICAVSVLAACNSTKDSVLPELEPADKPRIRNRMDVDRNWSVDLGDDFKDARYGLTPQIVGDRLYGAASDGKVMAIALETGKIIWRTNLKDELSGGVGAGLGLILVGSHEGILYALNGSDGSIRWQVQLSSEVLAQPVAGFGRVIARSVDGKMYGLDADNGAERWNISRPVPPLSLRGDSTPLLIEGVIVAGFPNGKLLAIDVEQGRVLWEIPVALPRGRNELERLVDVDGRPLLIGEIMYVASYQGALMALNLAERAAVWNQEIPVYHALASDDNSLFVTDKDGQVIGIDRATGETRWSQEGLKLRGVSAPATVGPYVIVSDFDGVLYFLNKLTGEFVGVYKLGGVGLAAQPLVEFDTIYVLNSKGVLQSLSINN